MKKIESLIVFMLLTAIVCAHENHIALLNITQQDDSTYVVSLKLHQPDFNLYTSGTNNLQFLNDNIHLECNGSPMLLQFEEVNSETDFIWLECRINYSQEIKKLYLKNTLFFQFFENQKHVVIVSINKQDLHQIFNVQKPCATFTY